MGKEVKYVVWLDAEEREQLQSMIDEGRGAKTVRQRARLLLKAGESRQGPAWIDERVSEFAEVSLSTVHRVRQRFVEEGFEAALFRKSATNRQYRKLDAAAEARLVAEACGPPERPGPNNPVPESPTPRARQRCPIRRPPRTTRHGPHRQRCRSPDTGPPRPGVESPQRTSGGDTRRHNWMSPSAIQGNNGCPFRLSLRV